MKSMSTPDSEQFSQLSPHSNLMTNPSSTSPISLTQGSQIFTPIKDSSYHTSPSSRFFDFLASELKRWFTSWLFWGWFIALEIFIVILVVTFGYGYLNTKPQPTPQQWTSVGLGGLVSLALFSTFFIAGIIAASDFRSHFSATSQMLFKNRLSWLGTKYLIVTIIITVYSALVYTTYWIVTLIVWKELKIDFAPPVPWWHYIFTLILLTDFLSLCTASASIIFKNWLGGFIFTYIVSGFIFLTLLFQYTPKDWHLEDFLFSNIVTNATNLTPKNPLIQSGHGQWSLPYWGNIGVAIVYPVLFIISCALIVVYWETRNFSFHKTKTSNKRIKNNS